MAYEVIKRVSGRAYRYRVESFRDPETKRVRGKWTYIGRVEGEGTLSPERKARPSSRDRLLDALEQLLEKHDLAMLSTGMVASEAGLAYGTFYRYFKDINTAVRDAMMRHSEPIDRMCERFSEPLGTRQTEASKVVAWAEEVLDSASLRPGLLRAWFIASNSDPVLIEERRRRHTLACEAAASYLRRSAAETYVTIEAPEIVAYTILALVESSLRESVISRTPTSKENIAGFAAMISRLAGY